MEEAKHVISYTPTLSLWYREEATWVFAYRGEPIGTMYAASNSELPWNVRDAKKALRSREMRENVFRRFTRRKRVAPPTPAPDFPSLLDMR